MAVMKLVIASLAIALSAFSAASPAASVITADGSSTVFPLTREAANRFARKEKKEPEISVRYSGTTAGFRRFCAGELDIGNASRRINAEEKAKCEANDVRFREIPIAMDTVAIVVHPDNDWASAITVDELRKLWSPEAEGKIVSWQQLREEWPDRPIVLFGRGQDSGTYDYFTHAIVGTTRSSRSDYRSSEDEEKLAELIAAEPHALGFFGIGAYHRHWDSLKLLAVDNGKGPVYPSLETVKNEQYQPLIRPLFLYVNEDSLGAKPSLRRFLSSYVGDVRSWIHFTGYMPLADNDYQESLKVISAPES